MVKIETVFGPTGDIHTINLLKNDDFANWTITLTPLRQSIHLDVSWMLREMKVRVANFSTNQLMWFKNLVPYIILDSTETGMAYEHKLNILTEMNHVCIFDLQRQQVRVLGSKIPFVSRQLKVDRYLATAYARMCQRLSRENLERTMTANIQSIVRSQEAMMETLLHLSSVVLDPSRAKSPTIRQPTIRQRPKSPTIRRPSTGVVSIQEMDDEKSHSKVNLPPIRRSSPPEFCIVSPPSPEEVFASYREKSIECMKPD